MIYILEDDDSIRELVVYTLVKTGYDASGFARSDEFWDAVHDKLPELCILDVMLPGEDGLSVLKRLRFWPPTEKLPVLMLTARDTEFDKVQGLDLGADDYLAKPVGMMELVARVKSLLRRSGSAGGAEEYHAGDLYLSVPRHFVSVGGIEITLTLKEFDLLVYLLKNRGNALSREQILAAVWGYEYITETRTVDTHIQTLRSKLGADAHVIATVRGVGYKAEAEA